MDIIEEKKEAERWVIISGGAKWAVEWVKRLERELGAGEDK